MPPRKQPVKTTEILSTEPKTEDIKVEITRKYPFTDTLGNTFENKDAFNYYTNKRRRAEQLIVEKNEQLATEKMNADKKKMEANTKQSAVALLASNINGTAEQIAVKFDESKSVSNEVLTTILDAHIKKVEWDEKFKEIKESAIESVNVFERQEEYNDNVMVSYMVDDKHPAYEHNDAYRVNLQALANLSDTAERIFYKEYYAAHIAFCEKAIHCISNAENIHSNKRKAFGEIIKWCDMIEARNKPCKKQKLYLAQSASSSSAVKPVLLGLPQQPELNHLTRTTTLRVPIHSTGVADAVSADIHEVDGEDNKL
jgi:hypothetical protein